MGAIISTIVVGAIVGLLARFFLRGNHNIGMLWTTILGIGGSFIGGFLAEFFFRAGQTAGIDWIRWILSVIAAMVLVSLYVGNSRRHSA